MGSKSDKVYTDIWADEYKTSHFNVNIFIGMRGMGKTFSALSPWVKGERDSKVMFNRLTSKETDIITSEAGNVFKDICKEFPERPPLGFFTIKKDMYSINPYRIEDYRQVMDGDSIGYCCSLVTLGGVCGMGMSDVGYQIIDEFIPRSGRYYGDKFRDIMACWETINRNRELAGEHPCKLILLSNSNNIYDDVLVGFGLVSEAEKMCAEGREHYYDAERSIAMHILKPTESFAEFKTNSAVARATKGTDYFDMAYGNSFAFNDFSYIEPKSVKRAVPLFSIASTAYIYRMQNGTYHVTYRRAEVPDYPINTKIYKRFFRRDLGYMENEVANGRVTYQSYELKELFLEALS